MTNYCVFNTRAGWVALAGKNGRLLRSTLPKKTRDEALSAIEAGTEPGAVEDLTAFGDLPGNLERYFAGETVDFSDVEIDVTSQAPFHAAVQLAAQKVPYGQLVTYKDLARMAGRAKAARAAGTAMARNLVPVIVPCHRVVASGGIGGFALGLEWKRSLLKLEGVVI